MTTQGMRAAVLARGARQLGHPHGWFGRHVLLTLLNRGNRPTVTGAVRALAAAAGDTVADIGFGGGLGLRLLLDAVGRDGRVHGVDISVAALDRARREFGDDAVTVHQGSITALPLPDHMIDGAICVNTVYFVKELDVAFAEVARVLRPGGRLVLGIADPDTLAKVPFARHGFIVREVDEVRAALRGAGLVERDHQRLGGFHLLVVEA